jgi:hypothetical protein
MPMVGLRFYGQLSAVSLGLHTRRDFIAALYNAIIPQALAWQILLSQAQKVT